MKRLKKEHGYILLTILIVIISGVLFFYPEGIEKLTNYKYPYSYGNLVDKKETIEMKNNILMENEGQIGHFIQELEQTKDLEEIKAEKALEVRKTIKESDFEFKISSILISLEQRAYENNVFLDIAYGNIKHIDNSGNVNDYTPEEDQDNQDNEEDETNNEDTTENNSEVEIKEKEKDNSEENETTEVVEEGYVPSEDMIEQGTVYIEGIGVAVIPIRVKGSYHNVRNYLKYLDKIGMIEPSSAQITSDGKSLTANIILNVFHGEVDL